MTDDLQTDLSTRALVDDAIVSQIRSLHDGEMFLPGLVRCFIEDSQQLITQFAEAAQAERERAAQDACHSLRSAAGSVGADRLSHCANLALHTDTNHLLRDWRQWHDTFDELLLATERAFREGGYL